MVRRAYTRLGTVLTLLALIALQACGSSESDPAPASSLKVTLSNSQVPADGTTVDVVITATEADGRLGEGTVVLTVSAGLLDGQKSLTSTLANGSTTVHWNCDSQTESCVGTQRITGEWKNAIGSARLEFQQPDSSNSDNDSGDDPGDGAASADGNRIVEVTASKNPICFRVGDYSDITAVLQDKDKKPISGESLTFEADFGKFTTVDVDDSTSATSSLTVTTNSSGEATLRFWEGGEKTDTVPITVKHSSGAYGVLKMNISSVQQITWVSTTCTGKDCTIMGIKGSGFNEQARIAFAVVDSSGKPAPGIKVKFSIPGSKPLNTSVEESGITDDSGKVVANISTGSSVGAFTVLASAVNSKDEVLTEAISPTIGIRGAKAANFGFRINCSPVNIPALVLPLPPASIDVGCSVKLVDRFNNPVGGTSVNFKTEAGTIPNDISTEEYKAGSDNSGEGRATIVFNSFSSRMPDDVDPLPADQSQYPYPREAEPSVKVGNHITKNPRDGLVTLIAYVRGEEYFWDLNQNGDYDNGEPFIDQGEPFVDNNDNDKYDTGEFFVDSNANGVYDGPDEVWNRNTTIWTETRILYTGLANPYNNFMNPIQNPPLTYTPEGILPFSKLCLDGVPQEGVAPGGSVPVTTWFHDENLNRLAPGTSFAASYIGKKGSLQFDALGGLADGFGISMERLLLNSSGTAECTRGQSTRCSWHWRTYYYTAGNPAGSGSVLGEEPKAGKPVYCAYGTVKVSVTTAGITTSFAESLDILYSGE